MQLKRSIKARAAATADATTPADVTRPAATAARASSLRDRLSAAACMLLASSLPGLAHAADVDSTSTGTNTGGGGTATTQIDASGLLYGEQSRARVAEPTVRVTRLYPNGQSLSAQLGIDVITGASPSGALPSSTASTTIQTVTSASGRGGGTRQEVIPAGTIPLKTFGDTRVALDADWTKPLLGTLTSTLGGHFSREKDYQSIGANAKFSMDLMQRLTTITAGGGINHDDVFPKGGVTPGLADPTIVLDQAAPKQVTTGLVGISRILTRRWMVAFNLSRTWEQGYLTEPYKVVSLLDSTSGEPVGQLSEKRPSRRNRENVLASSVYHLSEDVVYASYRRYWDDWGVRSNTLDLKYRHDLPESLYIEPHVRYYWQSPADFYTYGLVNGAPLPTYATSDFRLGALHSATVGATFGFQIPDTPGEWTVRAEYIRQTGNGHPASAIGVQQQYDLFPALNIGSVVIGYTLGF